MDLSRFNGRVELVTHAQDASNYDFVALHTDGTISQGRVSGGNGQIFAEDQYRAGGMLFFRVVVNDTHFRAYINREMAVYDHRDAPAAGNAGLILKGSGIVIIDRMELSQLN